jgi:hypothetical protein
MPTLRRRKIANKQPTLHLKQIENEVSRKKGIMKVRVQVNQTEKRKLKKKSTKLRIAC